MRVTSLNSVGAQKITSQEARGHNPLPIFTRSNLSNGTRSKAVSRDLTINQNPLVQMTAVKGQQQSVPSQNVVQGIFPRNSKAKRML